MPASLDTFDLRGFLAQVERNDPRDLLRFRERIALDYEATAITLEPVQDVVYKGADVDLSRIPIKRHFEPDAGQQKNAAIIAFAEDISLKLVIVVDEDVDVFDDQDVFWAMATRIQADEDIDMIKNAFGTILDPSNHAGRTSKMIFDATKPRPDFAQRHTLPAEAIARAKALIASVRP